MPLSLMTEVYPSLFVGSQDAYESSVRLQQGWSVVHACKEPYHRQALGYSTAAAPKTHPEYLIARRANRLILNLVDANDPAYIPEEAMNAGVEFIHERLLAGDKVLVHCNQGQSRSPSLAMLFLGTRTGLLPRHSFPDAVAAFRSRYPRFNPANGVYQFLQSRWDKLPGAP